MNNIKLTATLLSKIYGFDVAIISRWQNDGLNMEWDNELIFGWIIQNKIDPLRKADPELKRQNLMEDTRLKKANADLKEMEKQILEKSVIKLEDIESDLLTWTTDLKNKIRSIPVLISDDLRIEAEDPVKFKFIFQEKIDEVLENAGSVKYEREIESPIKQGKRSTKAAKKN
ncbi:hypothetical protein SM907_09630 [Klebsiella aerogenes]|uniref:hypothetical protein n=1 Tax=Klebsiella aerogenes TaxID=548 RepID=UPI00115B6899|nr:hypothetical protein [Klebsiella aerogenes]WPS10211.1 hypothetical protein SM907_09630 [Klebsiella aerogenes]VAG21013.1 Uncharacterised protein [Klebsiella aerogenes]